MSQKRITIIGAGPIGLEAALYAVKLGYRVTVFDKGRVGENIRCWGHVQLFSPWEMNHSGLGALTLHRNLPTWDEPAPSQLLSGEQFVTKYLEPLSQLPELAPTIHPDTEVVHIGRKQIFKGELLGDSKRTFYPFQLLIRSQDGVEAIHTTDIVIDASGVYANPNSLGDGGIPALGESAWRNKIDYHLRDIVGKDRPLFAGKKTLLIGTGYSAATTVCDFQKLIQQEPSTSLIWVSRGKAQRPIPVINNDQLEGRVRLTQQANSAATTNKDIRFLTHTTIESVAYSRKRDNFLVTINTAGVPEAVTVDKIIANVGYSPDNSLYRELQVHECYASRGPMKLAAALLGTDNSADCLAQTSMGPETLRNPEPNFYIVGNKSYGRNSTFLIRAGLKQIVEVFTLITKNKDLDLHKESLQQQQVTN